MVENFSRQNMKKNWYQLIIKTGVNPASNWPIFQPHLVFFFLFVRFVRFRFSFLVFYSKGDGRWDRWCRTWPSRWRVRSRSRLQERSRCSGKRRSTRKHVSVRNLRVKKKKHRVKQHSVDVLRWSTTWSVACENCHTWKHRMKMHRVEYVHRVKASR